MIVMTDLLPPAGPPNDGKSAAKKNGQPLVLVVDDHVDTREMLRYLMETRGCCVLEASDGEQAVRLAQNMLPDLILMDISLPHVDGLNATVRIRKLEENRQTKIIFLSGHAQPQSREMALAAGGDDYLVKPVNLSDLELSLERLMGICSGADL